MDVTKEYYNQVMAQYDIAISDSQTMEEQDYWTYERAIFKTNYLGYLFGVKPEEL